MKPETFWRKYTRDDGETEVEVEFEVYSWGCAAHMGSMTYAGHPAEGPEISLVAARLLSEEKIELTEAEIERFEQEFCENPPEFDYGED